MQGQGEENLPQEIFHNPLRDKKFMVSQHASPRWFHARLPGYAPTPLHDVPQLATRLGVRRLLVKNETSRLGLPAFKILGASWACYRALCERMEEIFGREEPQCQAFMADNWQTIEQLAEIFRPLQPLTLATATDGNHGRAVARMAKLLGFSARIWVPSGTAKARIRAIESEGASVTEVAGGYDEAVATAAQAADTHTLVVSDTSWAGYERIPHFIIEGYATILEEVAEQLAQWEIAAPDMAIVPIGVGAFAAAVGVRYRRDKDNRTALWGVEPVDAACVLKSVRHGDIVTLDEPQHSIMAGLNCGTPSPIAWPVVSQGFDGFVSINDEAAIEAMRLFARQGIRVGESAAASLAGLLQMKRAGEPLLTGKDTILLFATEGVTNPDFYAKEVEAKLDFGSGFELDFEPDLGGS